LYENHNGSSNKVAGTPVEMATTYFEDQNIKSSLTKLNIKINLPHINF